jgi:hypothetical protein
MHFEPGDGIEKGELLFVIVPVFFVVFQRLGERSDVAAQTPDT